MPGWIFILVASVVDQDMVEDSPAQIVPGEATILPVTITTSALAREKENIKDPTTRPNNANIPNPFIISANACLFFIITSLLVKLILTSNCIINNLYVKREPMSLIMSFKFMNYYILLTFLLKSD